MPKHKKGKKDKVTTSPPSSGEEKKQEPPLPASWSGVMTAGIRSRPNDKRDEDRAALLSQIPESIRIAFVRGVTFLEKYPNEKFVHVCTIPESHMEANPPGSDTYQLKQDLNAYVRLIYYVNQFWHDKQLSAITAQIKDLPGNTDAEGKRTPKNHAIMLMRISCDHGRGKEVKT